MAAHKEVEVKFLIDDLRALQDKLRACGFQLSTPRTHESNTLYDSSDRRLRRAGQLLRIRNYGGRWLLTHKSKAPSRTHKARIETETEIANGNKLDAILRALGFTPAFHYEKFRAEWSDGTGHVLLDETPIGSVAEIEGPPRWIDRTARRLGVSRAQYITSNYAQMFEDWKRRTGSHATDMSFAAVRHNGVR